MLATRSTQRISRRLPCRRAYFAARRFTVNSSRTYSIRAAQFAVRHGDIANCPDNDDEIATSPRPSALWWFPVQAIGDFPESPRSPPSAKVANLSAKSGRGEADRLEEQSEARH